MTEDAGTPLMLASDAERDTGIAALKDAVVTGRLTLTEFTDRVGRAQLARTALDLAVLTSDLPSPLPATTSPTGDAPVAYRATFSRIVRNGRWQLPTRSRWRSVFGTIELDLGQARLTGPVTEMAIDNLFGTVTVRVPDGVAVEVTGGGLFASQVVEPPASPPPAGSPILRIRLRGPGGTLHVRSSPAAVQDAGRGNLMLRSGR